MMMNLTTLREKNRIADANYITNNRTWIVYYRGEGDVICFALLTGTFAGDAVSKLKSMYGYKQVVAVGNSEQTWMIG